MEGMCGGWGGSVEHFRDSAQRVGVVEVGEGLLGIMAVGFVTL